MRSSEGRHSGPGRRTRSSRRKTALQTESTVVTGCLPGRATLPGVNPESPDGDRIVDMSDDDPILPELTTDDTDAGWGEHASGNEDRLLEDRPPHWDD